MQSHIEVVKKAIEFKNPAYLPMEIVDVPGLYNAYHTLDPDTVQFIPGTENADSLRLTCHSWFHEEIGKTPAGEILKKDQFGTILKTPLDMHSSHAVIERPLIGKDSLAGFSFPNPDDTDRQYEKLGKVIKQLYPDRFVNAQIDPGLFFTTMMLMGQEDFLIKLHDNLNFVIDLYAQASEYYKALVVKFKESGAHMITLNEDLGSTASLLISPDLWREHFKPITTDFFKFVHSQGLYTGILLDGNCSEILDDLLEMDVDVFTSVDAKMSGLETVKEKLKGKICIKTSVDVQTTLPLGTPEEAAQEAHSLVEKFNSPQGGYISYVIRWHRPSYPTQNVLASVNAFNEYRKVLISLEAR